MEPTTTTTQPARKIFGPTDLTGDEVKLLDEVFDNYAEEAEDEAVIRLTRMPTPATWAFTREFAGAAALLCFAGEGSGFVTDPQQIEFLGRLARRFQEIAGEQPAA